MWGGLLFLELTLWQSWHEGIKGWAGVLIRKGSCGELVQKEQRPLICTPRTSAMMSSNMTSPLPLILPDT